MKFHYRILETEKDQLKKLRLTYKGYVYNGEESYPDFLEEWIDVTPSDKGKFSPVDYSDNLKKAIFYLKVERKLDAMEEIVQIRKTLAGNEEGALPKDEKKRAEFIERLKARLEELQSDKYLNGKTQVEETIADLFNSRDSWMDCIKYRLASDNFLPKKAVKKGDKWEVEVDFLQWNQKGKATFELTGTKKKGDSTLVLISFNGQAVNDKKDRNRKIEGRIVIDITEHRIVSIAYKGKALILEGVGWQGKGLAEYSDDFKCEYTYKQSD